jgi:hypothetical protein
VDLFSRETLCAKLPSQGRPRETGRDQCVIGSE